MGGRAAHRAALFLRARWFDLGTESEVAVEEPPLSDEELAYRAASGDRGAFERLHKRHLPGLYDFAVRVVRDRGLAARAVKAAAGEARTQLADGGRRGAPRTLLYITLHHAALDAVLAAGEPFAEDPELPLAPADGDGRAVWDSAAALAPQDYALLDLHVRRELGADELAAGLGVARGGLALRLERLQQDLGAYAGGVDPATAARILRELHPVEPPGPRLPHGRPTLPRPSTRPSRPTRPKRPTRARRPTRPRPPIGRKPLLVAGAVLLAAATTGAVLAARGGGVDDPAELSSLSHRVGEAGANVVAVSWSPQPDGQGYSVLWTRDAEGLPDETVDLPASATSARSHALAPGRWWFALRTHGSGDDWSEGVRLGPFVVPDAPAAQLAERPQAASRLQAAIFRFEASESGATFECALDAADFRPCKSPQRYRHLKQGEHRLAVRAIGISGVAGEPAVYEWTIDTRAPRTRFTDEPPSATRAKSARFRFAANEGGVRFACKLDDSPWHRCTSPQSFANLTEATHRFAVKARDRAGNVDGTPAVVRWAVDRTPPDTSIRGGGGVTGRTASFTLAATESGVGFSCSLDDAGFTACSSSLVLSGLGAGTHTLRVLATDEAGNADASPAERSWRVDTRPPETLLVEHPPSVTRSPTATFAFSSPEGGATFQCSLDGRAFSPCPSRITYIGLTSGEHVLAVRARDRARNVDPTPVSWRWRVR
jgi:DNA-directed RNA polymerase specialized sigma24 family protein